MISIASKTFLAFAVIWSICSPIVRATTYDITWTEVADLPEQRSDMTATTVSDKIYVIGGCKGHQVSCDWWDGCSYCPSVADTTLVYTPSSDSWETLEDDMPRERYRHSATVVGSSIYLIGGRDVDDNLISEVDVLDTEAGTWSTLSSECTSPRSDMGTFAYNDLIYVVGGYDFNYTAYSSVDILDPDTGSWTFSDDVTTISGLASARGDIALVEADDLFYVFGGWSSDDWCNPLSSTEVYDPAADTWTTLAELQEGRGDKACGTLDGKLYAIGGEHNNVCTSGSNPVTDVEVYDPDSSDDGWVVEGSIPEAKFRFASATYDDTIYVFGGQRNESDCDGYDYCFPVSNHSWAFTDDSYTKKSTRESNKGLVLAVVLSFVAVAAVIAAVVIGCNVAKSGKCPGMNNKKPSSGDANPLHTEVPASDDNCGVGAKPEEAETEMTNALEGKALTAV